jgi:mannosyltransferase OCH1-like enzyme
MKRIYFLAFVIFNYFSICEDTSTCGPDSPLLNFTQKPQTNKIFNKRIPQNLWIAVVNKSEVSTWPHILNEIKVNPTWNVHLVDNEMKDKFMNEYFAGTSVLWAYQNINPVVGGAAKADIWRYCVLYIHGGVYIDADSALTKDLNNIIKDDDELVLAMELNDFDGDWCYSPNSKLSTIYSKKYHPLALTLNIFNNKNILNWCIMSAPNHFFFEKVLENFVHSVRLEYIGLGELKMNKHDNFSKHVYCTTGPSLFTASLREAVLLCIENENFNKNLINSNISDTFLNATKTATTTTIIVNNKNNTNNNDANQQFKINKSLLTKYRIASRDFIKEGAVFKAINTHKNDKNHYTKVSVYEHHFLLQYATEQESILAINNTIVNNVAMQGTLIMGRHKKSVYYLDNGVRRPIGGLEIFYAMNFSLTNVVHYSDFVIANIPLGEKLG